MLGIVLHKIPWARLLHPGPQQPNIKAATSSRIIFRATSAVIYLLLLITMRALRATYGILLETRLVYILRRQEWTLQVRQQDLTHLFVSRCTRKMPQGARQLYVLLSG
jgi:hypothetical protein